MNHIIGSHDFEPGGGQLPMVGAIPPAPAEEPDRRYTEGPSVARYDWADTFAYKHRVGVTARSILVHFAHVGGIKNHHQVWEARETTAAHVQCSGRAVTKAVKLLVNLGALLPGGKHQNLNGQFTQCYRLAGQYTEWLVPSAAQVEAVEKVRQTPHVDARGELSSPLRPELSSPKPEVPEPESVSDSVPLNSDAVLQAPTTSLTKHPSNTAPIYKSGLGELSSPLLGGRHESDDELKAIQRANWEKTMDRRASRGSRGMAARL